MEQEEFTTKISDAIRSNRAATLAVNRLYSAGGTVYVVGGAVRDTLLGQEPNDVDLLVTGLRPEWIEDALRRDQFPLLDTWMDKTGNDFGVYRFVVKYASAQTGKTIRSEVEIALPRTERSTGDGHKDFEVVADHTLPVAHDLWRRDFTCNAIAYNIEDKELIDPYGGRLAIAEGRVETVNVNSFLEDPLRMLRAIGMVSRKGFNLDRTTHNQIVVFNDKLSHISPERIQAELDKIMAGPNVTKAIDVANTTGLLYYVFPELADCWFYDQRNKHHDKLLGPHMLHVLNAVTAVSDDPDLRLAALLHDIGKPAS